QHEFFAANRVAFMAMVEVVTHHRNPDGSVPFAAETKQEVDALSKVLAAGQSAGEFRDFDPGLFAVIIIRASEGVLGTWAMTPETDLTSETTALLDFIDHAI